MILLTTSHDVSAKRRKISAIDPSTPESDCRISVARTGKINQAMLPEEYKLARLVEELENLDSSWITDTPACEWFGVKCNERSHITEIHWDEKHLSGELFIHHFPETLFLFSARNNNMTGRALLGDLLPIHETFIITKNHFHGELDLTVLPQSMKVLRLSCNGFAGEVCLTSLPPRLEKLFLSRNRLCGTPNLTALPPLLLHLGLSSNAFSGTVDLSQLPRSLREVSLSNNPDLLCRMKYVDELQNAGSFAFTYRNQ
eukprot:CAMPEP_0201476060 /NCGR_PEP_ID=MMETSP0151_2-20130828/1359_1 /ASSEMBLY_ACC=CAM_ASM_000257 /TAXON_ID=200890 /ORGANISM="Paramoeba atlantica, Strain 621/1 / CCAP 1560/9" /LENGTH=256 /DNA_ID=CAMNT_0047856337 /DNA_START=41 /DNA_END=811 /DNA_ORIENTATION=-